MKLQKYFLLFFVVVFLAQMIGLSLFFALPGQAAPLEFTPQITIPGEPGFEVNKSVPVSTPSGGYQQSTLLANYIKAIYKYSIGIIGILAAIILMWGGVIWLTAGGIASRIGDAKAWIGAALSGLVLALCSFLILSTINPDLVNLSSVSIKGIAGIETGCCIVGTKAEGGFTESMCASREGSWMGPGTIPSQDGTQCVYGCCSYVYKYQPHSERSAVDKSACLNEIKEQDCIGMTRRLESQNLLVGTYIFLPGTCNAENVCTLN